MCAVKDCYSGKIVGYSIDSRMKPAHAEQPVVQKETVPVERVKLDTETVTGEQEITEQVRKEHIDVDGNDDQASNDR